MSFRQYGGRNYAARNNIVKNNYTNANNLSVMTKVGQPSSVINFESDISGNTIYGPYDFIGDVNITGNLNVSGTTTLSSTLNVNGVDALINGLTVGLGGGQVSTNTALGFQALSSNNSYGGNTAVGYQSLYLNTSTENNTAVGYKTLFNNTNGFNTALGESALFSNTSGDSNTGLGLKALYFNLIGTNNVAVGRRALACSASSDPFSGTGTSGSGSYNVAVGNYSLYLNNNGSYNTAIGDHTLFSNTTGYDNTAVGYYALFSNKDGNNNTAFGYYALKANESSYNNTAIGYNALAKNTGPKFIGGGYDTDNTAVGNNALYNNTTGFWNTAVGLNALYRNITGSFNTAIGLDAGNNYGGPTNCDHCTFIGSNTSTGIDDTTDNNFSYSTAIGYNAQINASNQIMMGGSNNNGIYPNVYVPGTLTVNNTNVLTNSLYLTSGQLDTSIYATSLISSCYTSVQGNGTFINMYAYRYAAGTGWDTTASTIIQSKIDNEPQAMIEFNPQGYPHGIAITNSVRAGIKIDENGATTLTSDASINGLTVGRGGGNVNGNTAVGTNALVSNTPDQGIFGYDNTALGYQALYTNAKGYYNTAVGNKALHTNSGGYDNTAVGYKSLYLNETGTNNTAIGSGALYNNKTCKDNIAIGNDANYNNTTFQNTIVIGNNVTSTDSNQILIGETTQTISINGGLQYTYGTIDSSTPPPLTFPLKQYYFVSTTSSSRTDITLPYIDSSKNGITVTFRRYLNNNSTIRIKGGTSGTTTNYVISHDRTTPPTDPFMDLGTNVFGVTYTALDSYWYTTVWLT